MIIVAILLFVIGYLGCFVNKIPGPLFAFVGLLIAKFTANLPISGGILVLAALLVVASMVINAKYVPMLAKKLHTYGKAGKWGTVIGSFFGMIIGLAGSLVAGIVFMLALPYAFAWLFEYISTKNVTECSKRAASAFLVYLVSTVIKLAVVYLCFKVTIDNMSHNIAG